MSYRTIKTPEIPGTVTVNEVELAALDLARKLGAADEKGSSRGSTGTIRRKPSIGSTAERRRLEKKRALRRLKRRRLTGKNK
jgi:hypothetical protein